MNSGNCFAPTEEYGELLGHTIYFYSKDTGKPVKYVAPSLCFKRDYQNTQVQEHKNRRTRLFILVV